MTNTDGPRSALQAGFLTILPRIELHARIFFRHLRCPHRKQEAIQEVISISWKWYVRATERGKDVHAFVTVLADFAVRHVDSGRRLCGQERANDVLSPIAQQRHTFKVESLPGSMERSYESSYSDPHGQRRMDTFEERLHDNTETPVAEQAAFRIDYPAWIAQLGSRNREIVENMTLDHRTQELAQMHKLSPSRISQLRRELHADWQRFHGELV